MQFTSSASYLTPDSHTDRSLRILAVGPELLANAMHALLVTIDNIQALTPISEPDQTLPFIQRIRSTGHPIDVVILNLSDTFESDHALLQQLGSVGQRCLVVTSLYIPSEIELLKSVGIRGLFLSTMSVQQMEIALHTIANGQSYFPLSLPTTSSKSMPYLTKPRLVAFHEERLLTLARENTWEFTDSEINIFRHFSDMSIEEIATKVHLRPSTVRRELSECIYKFLQLISGRPVPNRFVAFQVVQEYGILEYIIPPPQKEKKNKSSRKKS